MADLYNESDPGTEMEEATISTPQDPEFLDNISKDFKRLQKQKSRQTGGVEPRILQSIAFVWGEHNVVQRSMGVVAESLDPNKLFLVFNLIEGRLMKLIGRLASIAPVFRARPDKNDPSALAEAEIVDN